MTDISKQYQQLYDEFTRNRKLDDDDSTWTESDRQTFKTLYRELLIRNGRTPLEDRLGKKTNKGTQRAHTRLEILPDATDPLISDTTKYVDVPWATIPTPKIDPSSWDNATIETVSLKELTATTEFLNRFKISKQIDAEEQKGNATIVELAGRKIIIDGHERLMALWLLGLDEAPVWIVKE